MPRFAALDWPVRLLLGALVAAGIGVGVVLLVRTNSDGSNEEVAGQATATPAATATATAPVATLVTTQPTAILTATAPPPTQAGKVPTADTRVAIRDLPTLDQIQLGKDGRYFIADRGDGCRWVESYRRRYESRGLVVYFLTDCPVDFSFGFGPETGDIIFIQQ